VKKHSRVADINTVAKRRPGARVASAVTLVLMLLAALSLPGCGKTRREVREETYPDVRIGMELAELEQMFGPGRDMSRDEALELFGELEADRFQADAKDDASDPKGVHWKAKDYALSVLLVNNEVVAKGQSGKLRFGSKGAGVRQ
jgi:hypothetical protein